MNFTFFWATILLVIIQRLSELGLAQRNARIIKDRGGFEVGAGHYKYIVAVHALFFLALVTEVHWSSAPMPDWWFIPFSIFLAAQGFRIWVIRSLGIFWNTRIYILPHSEPVRRGPYRFLRHPNYAVVAVELLTLPLTFGATYTAFLISALNLLVLSHRIAVEEHALREHTNYQEVFG